MSQSKPPSTTPDGTAQPVPSGAYRLSIGCPCEVCGEDATWWVYDQTRSNYRLSSDYGPRCDRHGVVGIPSGNAPSRSAESSAGKDSSSAGEAS